MPNHSATLGEMLELARGAAMTCHSATVEPLHMLVALTAYNYSFDLEDLGLGMRQTLTYARAQSESARSRWPDLSQDLQLATTRARKLAIIDVTPREMFIALLSPLADLPVKKALETLVEYGAGLRVSDLSRALESQPLRWEYHRLPNIPFELVEVTIAAPREHCREFLDYIAIADPGDPVAETLRRNIERRFADEVVSV
jgi:hypothetical protein